MHRRGSGFRAQMPSMALVACATGVLVCLGARPPWTAVRCFGLVLMLASLVLVFAARVELGSAFRVAPKAERLVCTGLYRRIRDPIYVFSTTTLAGYLLWSGRVWLWPLLGLIAVVQILRARTEARVLEAEFGAAYRAWKRQCWF